MKLIFTGDVNFRHFDNLTNEAAASMLTDILPTLRQADYRILNLEAVLARLENHAPIVKSGPCHGYSPVCVSFLEEAGADVAVLANNHTGDYGPAALLETLTLLDEHHIRHVGAGRHVDEAYDGVVLEKDGIQVSLLSVCENEFGMATEKTAGTAGYTPRKLLAAIRRERTRSDYVVVVFHGGNEFNPLPSPGTVERYRMICDMGANAVIAGHTHCPQGYEIYDGKPIVYSMGNLLFQSGTDRVDTCSWYYGYLAALTFANERVTLETYPYRFDKTGFIRLFRGTEKEKMAAYLQKLSHIITDKDELLRYYHGWCLLHPWFPGKPDTLFGQQNKLSGALDLMTCESHRDMITELYRLLQAGLEEEAKTYAEKITILSEMPV